MNYKGTRRWGTHDLRWCAFPSEGAYDTPVIKAEKWVPGIEFIGFNYARSCRDRSGKGVHFFVDDYQFERIWTDWTRHGKLLSQFEAVMTPDFSMFTDWSRAAQIWNHYRKHYVGAYLQSQGVRVYPSICWSDEASYDWCFDGEPVGGCVAVSSVGVIKNREVRRLFLKGYDEMLRRLEPETIIFYGNVLDECKGRIVRIRAFQDKFKEASISEC